MLFRSVCIRGEPLSAGSPAGRDFSAAARNSSQVLAHSRVTLLFFRPRLGEMLQDAGQPQHGGRCAPGERPIGMSGLLRGIRSVESSESPFWCLWSDR